MKRFSHLFTALLLLITGLAFAPHSAAASRSAGDKGNAPVLAVTGKVIPGQYIVVLKPGADAGQMAATVAAQPLYVYDAALNGFAARLDSSAVATLQKNPNVAYIEPDQVMSIDTTQTMDASGQPWGLDRIDQRALPLSRTYTYSYTASNVHAYVLDTGILTTHPDFGPNRASVAYDPYGGGQLDCNGHGTHVAGIIGGITYGVAKQIHLHSVRVLDCTGHGAYSILIAGINWVQTHAIHPAVANMSLGGALSTSVNTAVTNLANSGVFVAVSAGNDNASACNTSPASATNVYAVAASGLSDNKASFSNYGPCVDGYAPGVNIKSDWLNSGTNIISGTSMASPHVAGAAALYKSRYGDASSATITTYLNNRATANVIVGNPSYTPNRLLYVGP